MYLFKIVKEEKVTYDSPSYKDTEEYLKRQQKIDTLLVFAKLLEPGNEVDKDNKNLINRKISSTIESFK